MRKYFILFLLLQPFLIFPDTIFLKSGDKIQGRIIRQTLNYVEIELSDKKKVIFFKNQILKIIYTQTQQINRKIEELEKIKEQKKKLEEMRKKQEEENRKQEELIKQLEEQRKIEELKKLEEEQKKILEEQKRQEELLKEIQKKEEIQTKEIIEIQEKKEEEFSVKNQYGVSFDLKLGSINNPIHNFYNYYNLYQSLLIKKSNFQNILKTQSIINFATGMMFNFHYFFDPQWEVEINFAFFYQKQNFKFFKIPDKQNISDSYLSERFTSNSFQQKRYDNLLQRLTFRHSTENYFSYFWHYIFPYFELGYLQKKFEVKTYQRTGGLASRILSNNLTFDNYLEIQILNKALLQQSGFSFGIPFQFFSVLSSKFIIKTEIYLWGKSTLKQNIKEFNIIKTDIESLNFYQSNFSGNFSGRSFSFIWNNIITENLESNFIIENSFFYSPVKDIRMIIVQNLLNNQYIIYANQYFLLPFIFYRERNFNTIKEKYFLVSYGVIYKF